MKKIVSFILAGLIIAGIGTAGYFGYLYAADAVNQYQFYLLTGCLLAVALVFAGVLIGAGIKKKAGAGYLIIAAALIAALAVSSLSFAGILRLPDRPTVPDFYGKTLPEAQEWADANGIALTSTYENSDRVAKYSIMSQDAEPGKLASGLQELTVVVSDGPNYDKIVVVPNMLGWPLDDVVNYIKENFLNNVDIQFRDAGDAKYTVIAQDKYGEMARKEAVSIVIAYRTAELGTQKMIDMTGYSRFDAELWFRKNGIPYTLSGDFSDSIERGVVLSASAKAGDEVSPASSVSLVISKGHEITVGDLKGMSVAEVTDWVVQNNLNIKFSDAYDDTVELGKIVSVNHAEGEKIEEGTEIAIVVSKGPLKMQDFGSLSSFKVWADSYGIPYTLDYQFSDSVASGQAIGYSYKSGDVIPNGASITVTVSKGKAITMPSFIGKSRSAIQSSCNSLGLYCSFRSGSYSSAAADTATGQSVAAGSTVSEGTSVTLTLSLGPAKSWTLYMNPSLFGSTYKDTVNSLSSYFAANYPGVNFRFSGHSHSTLQSGLFHPDSPTNVGATVVQGKTYDIWIVK